MAAAIDGAQNTFNFAASINLPGLTLPKRKR